MGDTVIMDDLSAHKMAGVQLAIEAAGANLLYLPPYSPDFNPIEMAFSKLKALCTPLPNEAPTASGKPSSKLPSASHRPNARTTAPQQAMMSRDRKVL